MWTACPEPAEPPLSQQVSPLACKAPAGARHPRSECLILETEPARVGRFSVSVAKRLDGGALRTKIALIDDSDAPKGGIMWSVLIFRLLKRHDLVAPRQQPRQMPLSLALVRASSAMRGSL